MSEPGQPQRHDLSVGRGLLLAVGSVVLFFVALSLLNPNPIVDEGLHLRVIQQFAGGDRSMPSFLPMLPTYHALLAGPARLFGANLFVARACNMILGLLTIMLFAAVVKRHGAKGGGEAVLHFTWSPILFPFLVLVYTEVGSMLCLVAALHLQLRQRFAASAGVLFVAILVRQSNLVWVLFLAVWAVVEAWPGSPLEKVAAAPRGGRRMPKNPVSGGGYRVIQPAANPAGEGSRSAASPSRHRRILSRIWVHAVVLGVTCGSFAYHGGMTFNKMEAVRIQLNVAQFYLFALFVILLWAPIGVERARADWRAVYHWAFARPLTGLSLLLLVPAVIVLLVVVYENPHPWNQDLEYLRNWPLLAMAESLPGRILGVCCIVAALPVVVRFTREQPNRRPLALVWLFSLMFLFPHSLVEPRYYIIPIFLVNFFARFTAGQARRQTLWSLSITTVVSLVIAFYGHREGGIW